MGRALRIPTRRELLDVSRLALPIAAVQVGMMLMGVVDSAMVGRFSSEGLAAVALGNVYWMTVISIGQGTLMALDPLVSQAVGAGDGDAIDRSLQRGLVLCVLLSVVAAGLLIPGEAILTFLGQPPEVIPMAASYARACIPGVLPFLAFVTFRQTLQSFKVVRPALAAVLAANVFNVAADWALIYGHFGLPAMGAVGSAWASSLCRWVMALLILLAGRGILFPHMRRWSVADLRIAPLWFMARLGFPIGIQLSVEIGAFTAAMLLVGRLGTVPLAGHQLALTLSALTYMVTLGIGQSAAVLVGNAIGRGDAGAARREAGAALVCGVIFMTFSAGVLIAVPRDLARIFTTDAAIIGAATVLIRIAGVFQIFDGVQSVASGILRGAGDTRVPMWCNMGGYFFAVGLPLGAWLGLQHDWGAAGVWWGLVAALAGVATLLAWRVHVIMGGAPERVR